MLSIKQEVVTTRKENFRDLERGLGGPHGGSSREQLAFATNTEIARSEGRLTDMEASMTPMELQLARARFDAKLARGQAAKLVSMNGGRLGAPGGSHA